MRKVRRWFMRDKPSHVSPTAWLCYRNALAALDRAREARANRDWVLYHSYLSYFWSERKNWQEQRKREA